MIKMRSKSIKIYNSIIKVLKSKLTNTFRSKISPVAVKHQGRRTFLLRVDTQTIRIRNRPWKVLEFVKNNKKRINKLV